MGRDKDLKNLLIHMDKNMKGIGEIMNKMEW